MRVRFCPWSGDYIIGTVHVNLLHVQTVKKLFFLQVKAFKQGLYHILLTRMLLDVSLLKAVLFFVMRCR